jgi:glycosyltransferase involved in cell wall biosynthesis
VAGIRQGKADSRLMALARRFFYALMGGFSDTEHITNFNGFGLYDREVMEHLRKFGDPVPYFRGMISELGYKRAELPYFQSARLHGRTSTNFFRLYEVAMVGLVTYTRAPLRLAVFLGLTFAALSLGVAFGYLIYKLLHWRDFPMGMAPVVIGVFFLGSMQLMFLGIIGEYIGAIFTQVRHRPLVIEKERLNF